MYILSSLGLPLILPFPPGNSAKELLRGRQAMGLKRGVLLPSLVPSPQIRLEPNVGPGIHSTQNVSVSEANSHHPFLSRVVPEMVVVLSRS